MLLGAAYGIDPPYLWTRRAVRQKVLFGFEPEWTLESADDHWVDWFVLAEDEFEQVKKAALLARKSGVREPAHIDGLVFGPSRENPKARIVIPYAPEVVGVTLEFREHLIDRRCLGCPEKGVVGKPIG